VVELFYSRKRTYGSIADRTFGPLAEKNTASHGERFRHHRLHDHTVTVVRNTVFRRVLWHSSSSARACEGHSHAETGVSALRLSGSACIYLIIIVLSWRDVTDKCLNRIELTSAFLQYILYIAQWRIWPKHCLMRLPPSRPP